VVALTVIAINTMIAESFESFPYSIQNGDRKKPCIFYSTVFYMLHLYFIGWGVIMLVGGFVRFYFLLA
jgi:hypothetical protein